MTKTQAITLAIITFLIGCFITDNIQYKFGEHCSVWETPQECQARYGDKFEVVIYQNGFYQPVLKK